MRSNVPIYVVFTAVICVLPLASFAQKAEEKKAENKPQATVAAKNITFGTIAETDARVKNAIKADDLVAAKKHLEKEATFVGTVAKVFLPKSNSVVVLNFAEKYRTAVTAAVLAKDFAAFPDLSTLDGKKILIMGKVIDYRGHPEIALTKPEQIKLVK